MTPNVTRYVKDFIQGNNIVIASLKTQIAELQQKIWVLEKDNQEALEALQADCPHTYSTKEHNIPMFFANGATEHGYTVKCSSCSKVLESKSIRGTHAKTN